MESGLLEMQAMMKSNMQAMKRISTEKKGAINGDSVIISIIGLIFYQVFQEVQIVRFRYEIIKYLGGGTYGEVVKALDHKFDSEVAIKIRVIHGLSWGK